MKLSEAREAYYDYSRTASTIARQLAFAGIAVIWLFRIDGSSGPALPTAFLTPLVLIVLALAFDLLHYIIGAAIWSRFGRSKELTNNQEFDAPGWLNWPTLGLYYAKLTLVMIAYAFLVGLVYQRIVD